jgi:TPR repeat protein
VLKASAQAALRCAKADPHRLMNLDAIWDGPEIVIPNVAVRSQRIQMVRMPKLTKAAAREYALEQMDTADPATQLLKDQGDTAGARAQLEQRVKEHPNDAMAHYHLGCVRTAEDDLTGAMNSFMEARRLKPEDALGRKIQRQVRRLCALWLQQAQRSDTLAKLDAVAMSALGLAYENGWGVGVDVQEAKHWYRNAANAGHADAMYHLAAMYERRDGATVHTEQAEAWYRTQVLEWYRKAAELGNEQAKQWLQTHEH